LQLGIKFGLKVPAVAHARGACKFLVKRFKKSTTCAQYLKDNQREQGEKAYRLIMEVDTRWNSTYDMMERLVKLEFSVRMVISNPDVVSYSDARQLELTNENWSLIKQLLPLLKEAFLVTKMIQSQNYPSIALIYPSLYILYTAFDADESTNPTCVAFKERIKRKLNDAYYQTGYHTSIAMLASAIDPRFKHLTFLEPPSLRTDTYRALKEKIVGWTIDRLQQQQPAAAPSTSTAGNATDDEPSTSASTASMNRNVFSMFDVLQTANVNTMDDYDKVTSEVNAQFGHFLNEAQAKSDINPLEWWKPKLAKFPALEIAVRRLFCIPSTSAPVERVFSAAGNIVNKKRSSLLPENVDMLVFMYKNKDLYKDA
jgi:hypothetical protein